MTHDPEKPQLTKFRANPTHTDAGRRIDTWTILLVDGEKVEADVMLHAGHMSADFSIVFKTRELAHLKPRGADIDLLRAEVQAIVETYAAERLGSAWAAATRLTAQARRGVYHGETQVQIALGWQPVQVLKSSLSHNGGRREVIEAGRRRVVVERDPSDGPETLAAAVDVDPDLAETAAERLNARINQSIIVDEPRIGRSLVLAPEATAGLGEPEDLEQGVEVPDPGHAAILRLAAVLERFGEKLEAAVGPSRLGVAGIPDGAALVAMMAAAAAEVDPKG